MLMFPVACDLSSRCSLLIRTTDWYKHTRGASMGHSVLCLASKKRGFGPYGTKKDKESNRSTSETRNFVSEESNTRNQQAPQLASGSSRNLNNPTFDKKFLEKVEVVRRSAMEQKKAEEDKISQAIDYDEPVESEENTIGFATKVGVGVAVIIFGLVFAFGDFLPYGSVSPNEDVATVEKKLTEEEESILKTKLEEYKETLSNSPEDLSAFRGAIVTMKDLGEYQQASSLLEKMTKERPNNADAFRLLGDIKFELKDYDGSVSAYQNSLSVSKSYMLSLFSLFGWHRGIQAYTRQIPGGDRPGPSEVFHRSPGYVAGTTTAQTFSNVNSRSQAGIDPKIP